MPRAACKITEVPLICHPKSLVRFVVSTDTGGNSRGGPFVVAWEEEAGQEEMSEAADGLGEQPGGIGQDGVKTKESSQRATWRTAGAMGLLALMAALAGGAALRESPTFDEVAHIGAGFSYADKLDSRFNPEHPPLEKLLSGVFMKLGEVQADYQSPQWTVGAHFPASFFCEWAFGNWVLLHWNNPHTVLFWARLPMLLITLLLGWTIYWMANCLGGPWAGLLCLSIYVSTPTFLTFGPLVLTDVPIALFALLIVWSLASLWRDPSPAAAWTFAFCVAGGMLTKFSVVLVLFASLIAALSTRWAPLPVLTGERLMERSERRVWRRQRWFATWKGVAAGLVLTYAFDLIVSWNQPTDMLALYIPPAALRRILMPFVNALAGAYLILAPNRPAAFLMGHSFPHGTWLFFPVLFLVKSIPVFLAFLGSTLVLGLWSRQRKTRLISNVPVRYQLHWRFVWVALSVYATVCVFSKLNISVRHFTIPIALVILLMTPLPRLIGNLSVFGKRIPRIAGAVVAVLALDSIAIAVSQYPWFMPYHNFLTGNRPSYELFGDSNLDWNQGLFALEDFVRTRGLTRLPLDFYGASEPEPVIPQALVWDCQAPDVAADAGQWVAVSANMILDSRNCGWLLSYPRQAIAGGSMYAFQLPSPIPPAGAKGGPPLSKERKVLFATLGDKDLRTLWLELDRNPHLIEGTIKAMMEQVQKQQRK
jgi:hypothetical protein